MSDVADWLGHGDEVGQGGDGVVVDARKYPALSRWCERG
jgi:hypothetical protein